RVSTLPGLPNNQVLVLLRVKGGQMITGPLYLEITGLPKTVKLLTRHGTTHAHAPRHSPFVTEAPQGLTLPPGVPVGFVLGFSGKPSFGVRVLVGVGVV